MRDSIGQALSHHFSRREVFLLTLGAFGLLIALLFLPYLRSMQQWVFHKRVGFESDSISLPKRWVAGKMGHLLSMERPGATLLFSYQSTIVIDPFAERWPPEKLNEVSNRWLRFHGYSVAGRFGDPDTALPVAFAPNLKCVSTASSSERRHVQIYCLSPDSVLSFEFFGDRDAISDFAEVSAQALSIANKHPRAIWRKPESAK